MTTWIIGFQHNIETAILYKCELDELKLVGEMSFEEIKTKVEEAPTHGFFPTEQVSFLECLLPKTAEKRLRLALPGLLEEQLATSPEDNFYALPSVYQPGESTMIAVINLNYLQTHIEACKQVAINLVSLAPDCFLLPLPTEGHVKLVQSDRIVVRTSANHGFAIPSQHAVLLMKELEEVTAVQPCFSGDIPYNFLQAQFIPQQPKKPLGRMAWLYLGLAGLAGVHVISLLLVGAVLSSRLNDVKSKNIDLYAKVFPGATKVNSPKVLIERELQNYGAGVLDPLQPLILQLSQALSQTTGATLTSLDYARGALTADLILSNMDSLDQLNKALSESGIHSEQQVTEQNNTVLVQLVIHAGEKP